MVTTLTFLIMSACKKNTQHPSSPTLGEVNILADISLQNILSQEEDIFERNYKYAQVNITYETEHQILKSFLQDSAEQIICARKLNDKETRFLEERKLIPRHYILGTTAIAFINNLSDQDTSYTYEEIHEIIRTGRKDIQAVVIEHAQSGIARMILNDLGMEQFPSHVYAKGSKEEVINYVRQNQGSLGLIDWSSISDSDDPQATALLKDIRLLAISRPKDSIQYGFVHPYQYNLQDKRYPYTRDIYYISRSGKSDLGLGFASFIAGEIGQKIILKAGLLPAYQSERWIELINRDVRVEK